jgi:hypothetical protein
MMGGNRALVADDVPSARRTAAGFGPIDWAVARSTRFNRFGRGRPDIAFVIAVTPPGASPESAAAAKRNVESVFRSLLDDGVPADRIRLAAQTRPDVDAQEVRLFVR